MKNHIKHLFVLLLFLFFVGQVTAQMIYFPYYGKNKVLYEKFDWNHYQTDHFDIYYYVDNVNKLKNITEIAESAYQRISQGIKHQLSAPVPFIFYSTFTDFEQTNLFQIPEGVLGVAEPILYRVAIHGDMALDEMEDLIEHELTHIFEFDLLWGSPGGAIYAVNAPPLWVFEGFSEYNTQNWSSWSSLIVRDAVLNDRIPELNKSGELYSRYPLPRNPAYDFGHAIFEFIELKYGKSGIREFWQSLKNSPLLGKRDPIKHAFNLNFKEFNHEFKKYLRAKHKDFLMRENPEDYSISLGPEFPLNQFYFSFSHALSPSGDIVAILTYNVKDNDIDIVLVSTKDGSTIKNITKGYTWKYEHIKYEIDPSKGKDITWSKDGDKIAFFGRSGQRHSLFVVNALTGKTVRTIKIPFDQPSSPCFFPEEDALLFACFKNGNRDIFKLNLQTEEIVPLTEDNLYEKAPTISPDGKYIAYTIRLDTYDKLFLSPVDNLKKKTQLTFGRGNTISPEFSADGKEIYFSGDMRGAFNIYSLNLETGELKRYTDVRTGNFFPVPLTKSPNHLLFSSFNKGAFQVFLGEVEGAVEKTITFKERNADEEFARFEPIIKLEINKDKIQSYKGIGKLYLTSRPPVNTIISTDGSIYGGSSLAFTDMLADYTFFIMAYQVQNFRSYYFAYLNQKNRLQYMASAYQYTIFYYPDYVYYDPYLYNFLSYRDAIATRKISGVALSAYYPFNKFYRTEASLSYSHYEEDFYDPYVAQMLMLSQRYFNYFWNGNLLSVEFSLVGETTRFKYYGPASGNTFRLSLNQAIPVSNSFLRNTTVSFDFRQYIYLGADCLFAFRLDGFASRGKNPYVFYFGGNNQVRSSYYYNIIGNEGWYSNLEFRLPLVNSATTIIGQIGPVRGTFFFDIARSKLKGFPAKFYRFTGDIRNPLIEFDAIGSYGFGLEFFLLGLPIHLDFVKRLEFPDMSNPFDFNTVGSYQTKFWIGFDF
ncbi:MAG: PD40 domain-containing protein [Candidatus Aminicenantes bacterium]|nr:PD40 domain-containing protein [Candidatus Aminicenantes bacterium]